MKVITCSIFSGTFRISIQNKHCTVSTKPSCSKRRFQFIQRNNDIFFKIDVFDLDLQHQRSILS